MASQYGTKREYTDVVLEDTKTVQCPQCDVIVRPRSITSTKYQTIAGGEKQCPNCGKNLTRTWSPIT